MGQAIVEIRTDEYTRGALASYLEAYKTLARPALSQHVGEPLASYSSIVGKINCVVHIWGYDSMEAYAASRAATESDARWRDYLRATQGILRFTRTCLTKRVVFPGVDEQVVASRAKPVGDFQNLSDNAWPDGHVLEDDGRVCDESHAAPYRCAARLLPNDLR